MYFIFYATKKFVVFTRKQKHITLHSFYLYNLNMWQSPSKQHNSQFDVLDHKDKWMVDNELMGRYWQAAWYKHDSWEVRRKTHVVQLVPSHIYC